MKIYLDDDEGHRMLSEIKINEGDVEWCLQNILFCPFHTNKFYTDCECNQPVKQDVIKLTNLKEEVKIYKWLVSVPKLYQQKYFINIPEDKMRILKNLIKESAEKILMLKGN